MTGTRHGLPLHLGDVLCDVDPSLKGPVTHRKAPWALSCPICLSVPAPAPSHFRPGCIRTLHLSPMPAMVSVPLQRLPALH